MTEYFNNMQYKFEPVFFWGTLASKSSENVQVDKSSKRWKQIHTICFEKVYISSAYALLSLF